MQQILIQATGDSTLQDANTHLMNRSLLYNRDKDVLYIKYNDELKQLGYKPDNESIVLDDNNHLSLPPHIYCHGLAVCPDESGLKYQDNVIFAETTDLKRIVLLFKLDKDETTGTIGGKFYEMGEESTSGLNFSASVSGSRHLDGSSTGEMPVWCKCKRLDSYYLGIRFNPNTKIYFSGYNYIKNVSEVDFEYSDKDFDEIKFIPNDANFNTDRILITNPNSIVWDFTDYCSGLSSTSNETSPNTEYNLSDGLSINNDYDGSVAFYPERLIGDDVGYIKINEPGKALRFITDKIEPILKIYFSSNADEVNTDLKIWDEDENLVASAATGSSSLVQTLKIQNISRNKTYFIGSETSSVRIHKILLVYSPKEIVQDGWDAFNYNWDFDALPKGWSGSRNYNWGKGLSQINDPNGDVFEIYSASSEQIRESGETNQGYILTSGSVRNVFKINIAVDMTNLECVFSSNIQGEYRTLSLLDDNGQTLVQVGNKGFEDDGTSETLLSVMRYSNLGKGTYYLFASAPLRIYKIGLSNEGQQLVTGETENSNIESLIHTLKNLDESGEGGDAHYITVQDQTLSLEDLHSIAGNLRNSDVPVHLNLKDCSVMTNAVDWTDLFQNCTSLTYFGLPQGVKILSGTFAGCTFLKKVELCDTVEELNADSNVSTFSGTQVRTVILSKNCNKIGRGAFAKSNVRNIIVRPDQLSPFYNMLEYGSFFSTLNHINILMTQNDYDLHNWSNTLEHSEYFGDDCEDGLISEHISVYSNYDGLLEEMGLEEERI